MTLDVQARKVVVDEADVRYRTALEEERRDSVKRYTLALELATAVFLVPSLVIAIYSAQVAGVPGQGEVAGLYYMLAACLFGGLATSGLLIYLRRRGGPTTRRRRSTRPSAGSSSRRT